MPPQLSWVPLGGGSPLAQPAVFGPDTAMSLTGTHTHSWRGKQGSPHDQLHTPQPQAPTKRQPSLQTTAAPSPKRRKTERAPGPRRKDQAQNQIPEGTRGNSPRPELAGAASGPASTGTEQAAAGRPRAGGKQQVVGAKTRAWLELRGGAKAGAGLEEGDDVPIVESTPAEKLLRRRAREQQLREYKERLARDSRELRMARRRGHVPEQGEEGKAKAVHWAQSEALATYHIYSNEGEDEAPG